MDIVKADYDLTKLNKNKKILFDKDIIQKGFIRKLMSTTHTYDRFLSQQHEYLLELISNYKENNLMKI